MRMSFPSQRAKAFVKGLELGVCAGLILVGLDRPIRDFVVSIDNDWRDAGSYEPGWYDTSTYSAWSDFASFDGLWNTFEAYRKVVEYAIPQEVWALTLLPLLFGFILIAPRIWRSCQSSTTHSLDACRVAATCARACLARLLIQLFETVGSATVRTAEPKLQIFEFPSVTEHWRELLVLRRIGSITAA